MSRVAHLRLLFVVCVALVLCAAGSAVAQFPAQPSPTPPVNPSDDPLLRKLQWRSIGPASMGGRIDDVDAVESNPSIMYIGFATAGVWKSTNNGTTWTPIFDTYPVASVGDLAVCQSDPNIVWVGTGEPNNRQSSSWGDGIYKSVDAGKTFTNMGLRETHTIARVVIDPKDPNTVYVAALGHLFGPNRERGLYKTTDGGKTWNHIKFIDENTGFTDLAIDPVDSKTLYAASFQRRRTAWGFNGGGPGSGLWKTSDAGKNWTRLSGSGLPTGLLGRIGLDVSRSNPNVVYAQLEVGAGAGAGGGGGGGGFRGQGGPPGQTAQQAPQPPNAGRSGVWRSDDKGATWRIMSNNNNRPMYYSQIRVDPGNDQIVYTMGAPFHKSTDGGKTFQALGGIAHSDHHALWINPKNTNHLVLGTDGGLNVSYDQGATWEFVNTIAAAQFYAVGVDMRKPYYVYGGLQDNGSWGGPSATRSQTGITNSDWFRVGGGDGFYVQVDPTDHNTIYSESQNGAINRLDLRTGQSTSIRPRAAAAPRGSQRPEQAAEPSPEAPGPAPGAAQPRAVPAGTAPASAGGAPAPDPAQFGGGFFRGPVTSNIVPPPPVGEQYRFNWSMPIHISPHNPRTIYVGANKLFKSVNRGDTWTASPDLTRAIDRNTLPIMGVAGDQPMASKHDGTANYGNITTLAESPVLPGVLWVGTDDGNVQVSRDGGASWSNVAGSIAGIPKEAQVSRVEPSNFDGATCYVSLDAHRLDDFRPYIFVTEDYGKSWRTLAGNLPEGNVNVVKQDPKNKDLLFAGTEFGLYVSLNSGAEWRRLMTGMPTVRVDDIVVHPRDNDLIAATHGRGIYILDDITALQQWNEKASAADVFLFDIRPGTQWMQDVTLGQYVGGSKNFRGVNPPPGTAISYHLKEAPADDVTITISDLEGKVLRKMSGTKDSGMNRVQWNLRGDPPPRREGFPGGGGGGGGGGGSGFGGGGFGAFAGQAFEPGVYLVKLSAAGNQLTKRVRVEEDKIER